MAKWHKGAPVKLYVVVDPTDGGVYTFESVKERKEWLDHNTGTEFKKATYVQEVK